MKRVLLAASLFCFVGISRVAAQQEPRQTHYMFNQLSYNPAYAGSRDGLCAALMYHNQWTGFKSSEEGTNGGEAPITQTFTIHAPIPGIGVKGAKPYSGHLGAGLSIVNDKIGFEGGTGIMLNAAYIMPNLWRVAKVSVGINAGMMQQSLDEHWIAKDINDPRLPGSSSSGVFDAGAGVWLNSLNWFAGFSALHLPQSAAKWKAKNAAGTVDVALRPAYYFTGGYTKAMGSNLELQGYGQWETDLTKSIISLSGIALYKQMLYGGINARFEKLTALSLMAGYYPSQLKGLLIGFSWDVPTGHAKTFGGTPEVFLRYCFNLSITPEPPVWHKSSRWL